MRLREIYCFFSFNPSTVPFPGISVFETSPALAPLYELIVQSQLQDEGVGSLPSHAHTMRFYAVSVSSAPHLPFLFLLFIHERGPESHLVSYFLLYQSLPGQQHCYFLNCDAPVQDGRCLQGALVSKIPFRHPAQVPALLDVIRHQAAYNTLIASCVKKTLIKDGRCNSICSWVTHGQTPSAVSMGRFILHFSMCCYSSAIE